MKFNGQDIYIGGLFSASSDGKGKIGLQKMIAKFGQEMTWDMIEKEVSPYKNIPILHRVIESAPDEIDQVMSRFPHSLFSRDENNRLPIHVALDHGLKWSAELVAIMNASILFLNDKDPVTGFYPFMLAAKQPTNDLRTINYLLRTHPSKVEAGISSKQPASYESKRWWKK